MVNYKRQLDRINKVSKYRKSFQHELPNNKKKFFMNNSIRRIMKLVFEY